VWVIRSRYGRRQLASARASDPPPSEIKAMDRATRLRLAGLAAVLAALGFFASSPHSIAACNGPGLGPIIEGNVVWALKDSVSGCPAADSLLNTGHPSRLRINIWYSDTNCNSKVGVPPESIWVTTGSPLGNLKVNDEGARIYADDSTDAAGHARVTIPSFSGNGRITVTVFVAGVAQGSQTCLVRTTDTNADGRSNAADYACSFCWSDLNWSGGAGNGADLSILLAHASPKHWHRQALFGTPVKMTSLCDLCPPESPGTIGSSELTWAPSGKWLAYTRFNEDAACKVWITASDPARGNPAPFTFATAVADSHDYDPSWSPLGHEILFNRDDAVIYRKGIPSLASDTLLHKVVAAADAGLLDTIHGAFSPDGKMVAFTGFLPTGSSSGKIFMVSAGGGSVVQLTSQDNYYDQGPHWSPDGTEIVFERWDGHARSLYIVQAVVNPPLPSPFFLPGGSVGGSQFPAFAPDGQVVIAGYGGPPGQPYAQMPVATLDATVATAPSAVTNFAPLIENLPVPEISPDGTRLLERALNPAIPGALTGQLWATRRNMSMPPKIVTVGTQSVADTTTTVAINVKAGLQSTISVSAADPEGDAITYSAAYLQPGMLFSSTSAALTWTPPLSALGSSFTVKFSAATASGGVDAILAILTVVAAAAPARGPLSQGPITIDGLAPGSQCISFATSRGSLSPLRVEIFDSMGRVIAVRSAAPGKRSVWALDDEQGRAVPAGVYFYRVRTQDGVSRGKLVVVH
jgi:hypothetical protein